MTQPLKAVQHRRLVEKSQRICLDLLHTDIDLAYAFLRLADTELDRAATDHGLVLIGKAITALHSVNTHLQRLPATLEDEKLMLERDTRALYEAIAKAQARFHIRTGRNQTAEPEAFLPDNGR